MKKNLITSAFILIFLCLIQVSYAQTATEEYAIINVLQVGKKNFISVTIGSQSTEEKEYEKEKNDKRFDMAPVIARMEELNKMGFELVNSSTAMIPLGTSGGAHPFFTFTFKKKK